MRVCKHGIVGSRLNDHLIKLFGSLMRFGMLNQSFAPQDMTEYGSESSVTVSFGNFVRQKILLVLCYDFKHFPVVASLESACSLSCSNETLIHVVTRPFFISPLKSSLLHLHAVIWLIEIKLILKLLQALRVDIEKKWNENRWAIIRICPKYLHLLNALLKASTE